MRRLLVGAIATGAVALGGFAPVAEARTPAIRVKPGTFVGTASQCAPAPAGTRIVSSSWRPRSGLNGHGDKAGHALFLRKNGPTADCSAAQADVIGVAGMTLQQLSFDVRNDGHCGAGAPRFNVDTDAGLYFFGCFYGVHTAVPGHPDWTHVEFALSDGAPQTGAQPAVMPANAIVKSIQVVMDEGTDTGPDFTGTSYLDNISVNNLVAGRPGLSK